MFYRYISENLSNHINQCEVEEGNHVFAFAQLPDEVAEEIWHDLVSVKGFFVLPSELFESIRKRAYTDENLIEALKSIFKNIEAYAQRTPSEVNFKVLFHGINQNSNNLSGTVLRRYERKIKIMNGVGDMRLEIIVITPSQNLVKMNLLE